MKTRKILPLLALAVLALFVLAGCDAMLESIYPNETNPPVIYNDLTVDVYTNYLSVGNYINYGLTVVLYKDGTAYSTFTTPLYYNGTEWIETYYTFTDLPDGSYTAYAWIDYSGDGTTLGDYDYGYYWPAVQSDLVTYGIYLSGGTSGYLTESVYYYGYNAK